MCIFIHILGVLQISFIYIYIAVLCIAVPVYMFIICLYVYYMFICLFIYIVFSYQHFAVYLYWLSTCKAFCKSVLCFYVYCALDMFIMFQTCV